MIKAKWTRAILVLMSCLLALSLFACGDKETDDGGSEKPTAEKATEAATEDESDVQKETAAETAEQTDPTGNQTDEGSGADETEKSDESSDGSTAENTEESAPEETKAPETVKCKHKNAEISIEKGCIVWCSDCESRVGAKTYHKNSMVYFDNEGFFELCANCGTKAGEGKKYLVEWDAKSLGEVNANGLLGVYNQEGDYTRFEGDGKTFEAHMPIITADAFNTEVTGQYFMMKYRTNIDSYNPEGEPEKNYKSNIQIYCGTQTESAGKGRLIDKTLVSDDQWHIVVIDLSDGSYYIPDNDGNYVAKHIRLDITNPKNVGVKDDAGEFVYAPLPAGYYFDIGFIALCSDPDAFVDYFEANEAERALCNHEVKYVNDLCKEACAGCGEVYGDQHTYSFECNIDDATGNRTYAASCAKCDDSFEYTVTFNGVTPNLFLDPEAIATNAKKGKNMGKTELMAEDGTGFVRLHADTSATSEGLFFLIPKGNTQVTGQYMLLKYRTTCGERWEIFTNGVGTTPSNAGRYDVKTTTASPYCNPLRNDGEWQIMIVDIASLVTAINANKDGTYTIGHYRWDIFDKPSTEERHIDVAYVAFAGDLETLKAINCKHDSISSGFTLVTDTDPATDTPMRSGKCTNCGSDVVVDLNRKFYIDGLLGSVNLKPRDAIVYDFTANNATAAADNTISLTGWAGVDFGFDAIAYKVYGADGRVLNDGWQTFEAEFRTPNADNAVTKAVIEAGIDGAHARRFDDLKIDLGSYFSDNESVTVEYALIINGIPEESNDLYVPFFKVTNIKPAQ